MNMFAMSVLVSTLGCLIWGVILGMIRGRNRSILRLVLIVISAVIAIAMRNTLVDTIMGLEVDGQTLRDALMAEMAAGESEAMAEFMSSLFSVLFGLVSYLLIFSVLQIVTWMIIFPICKIFVKKDKDKKKKGAGALIGLVQGLIIAFVTCAPLTGMLVHTEQLMKMIPEMDQSSPESSGSEQLSLGDEISTFEVNGETVMLTTEETPEGGDTGSESGEQGADEMTAMFAGFSQSPIAKIYTSIGGWYYEMVSTVEIDGVKVGFGDYVDVLDIMVTFMADIEDVTTEIENLPSTAFLSTDRIEALRTIGTSLKNIGGKVAVLDEGGNYLMNIFVDMVIEMLEDADGNGIPDAEEGNADPELQEVVDNLTVESFNFSAAGKAFVEMADYLERVLENKEDYDMGATPYLEKDEVAAIVDAVVDNVYIKTIIGETQIIQIQEYEQQMFSEYIASREDLSLEDRENLLKIFGIGSI